jgi:hypothetical protein
VELLFGEQSIELPWNYTASHALPTSGLGGEILIHLSLDDNDTGVRPEATSARDDLARAVSLVAKVGPRVKVNLGDKLFVRLSPEHAHFFDVATGETLRGR